MKNTTYSGRRTQDGAQESTRRAARGSGRGASQQRTSAPAGESAAAKASAVVGAAGERANALLSNLPFPKSYLLIGLVAIILIVIIATSVSNCGSKAPEQANQNAESAESADNAQAQQTLNSDIPEELRWRDADFAVDPARTEWTTKDNGRKVVYLTIDDGPSALTQQFLDVLDQYNAKATFFVTGQNPEYYNLIHEAYKRGHTIGLHSMSHKYDQIYSSEDAYFSDLDAIGQVVKEQIGYVPCFTRFPGGSSNTQAEDYSKGIMPKLVAEVQKRGYQYFDWSGSTGDGADLTTDQIMQSVKDGALDTNIVLLAHDSATKQTTLEALPKIIEYYQNLGYTFEAIDRDTWAAHHNVYTPDNNNSSESADGTTDGTDSATDGTAETTDDTGETYEETYQSVDETTYYDDGTNAAGEEVVYDY